MVDLGRPLGQPLGFRPYPLGLLRDPLGALQRLRYAVLPGPLVELGQLGREGGEPGGEIVGPEPRSPYAVQRVRGGQQRLAGALDGRGEPGELRLRLAEQRFEALFEAVQLLLDPAQFVLGAGELGPGLGGDRRLQVVTVEVVGIDGGDVILAGLVDAPSQRLEVGDGAAGRGEASTAVMVSIEIRRSRWAVSSS